jgi:outer membrane autotransporter protein
LPTDEDLKRRTKNRLTPVEPNLDQPRTLPTDEDLKRRTKNRLTPVEPNLDQPRTLPTDEDPKRPANSDAAESRSSQDASSSKSEDENPSSSGSATTETTPDPDPVVSKKKNKNLGATTPSAITVYRPNIALSMALPAILTQDDTAMLATLHQRIGDAIVPGAPGHSGPQLWARFINQETRLRPVSQFDPYSEGSTSGIQTGIDLFATAPYRFGLYGGSLEWRHTVGQSLENFNHDFTNQSVGYLQGHSRYAGLYSTYQAEAGWYSSLVLQQGWQRGWANAINGSRDEINGRSTLLSLEIGLLPLHLTDHWRLEPQLQITGIKRHLRDVALPTATLHHDAKINAIGRIGLRLKGEYQFFQTWLQPYLRVNLWHGLQGTDSLAIRENGADTTLETKRGHTSVELAAGSGWRFNRHLELYAEVGRMLPLAGAQRLSAQHTMAVGLRFMF